MPKARVKPFYSLKSCDYERAQVPRLIADSLDRWGQYGVPTGGFLRAVLENDLTETICRADTESLLALRAIVVYVCNALPACCHGSPEKVREHRERCTEQSKKHLEVV